ncbi:response regulator transcription factor [Streptomyces sp. NPDC059248]|uniref:response regulator transcription factor n=1 Tax=Streptomyces sp. NPDC059248 TaxID=3346791 RepID=UPI0036979614
MIAEYDDGRAATAEALARLGFATTAVGDGAAALRLMGGAPVDAVVTDMLLPGPDGVGLIRSIRERSAVPILMITGRDDDIEGIAALAAGADDYVPRPLRLNVVDARLRALLRRATAPAPAAYQQPCPVNSSTGFPTDFPAGGPRPAVRTVGDVEIDQETHRVRVAGRPVALTPTETRLLTELAGAPGTVVRRDTLLRTVWHDRWRGDTRVVDVHVQRLRAKIGSERIVTVRGFGYKIVDIPSPHTGR